MIVQPQTQQLQAVQPISDGLDEAICKVLSEILDNGVDVHRCLAAQALGSIGGEAVVEPLIAALLDEDEDVRTDAAAALSKLADPRSGKQLMENLLGMRPIFIVMMVGICWEAYFQVHLLY